MLSEKENLQVNLDLPVLPVQKMSRFPPALKIVVFLPLPLLSLQRGAEHWIASQPVCPRCGLFRGMRASKREKEGGGERARESEREAGMEEREDT